MHEGTPIAQDIVNLVRNICPALFGIATITGAAIYLKVKPTLDHLREQKKAIDQAADQMPYGKQYIVEPDGKRAARNLRTVHRPG